MAGFNILWQKHSLLIFSMQFKFILESHVVECSKESFTHTDFKSYFICVGVGVRSAVVERATHMRMYAVSSPTGVDHREELI